MEEFLPKPKAHMPGGSRGVEWNGPNLSTQNKAQMPRRSRKVEWDQTVYLGSEGNSCGLFLGN